MRIVGIADVADLLDKKAPQDSAEFKQFLMTLARESVAASKGWALGIGKAVEPKEAEAVPNYRSCPEVRSL